MNNNKLLKKSKSKLKKEYYGWFFCLPFVAGLLLYYIWVILDSLRYSFSSIKLGSELLITNVGFENYRYALRVHPTFLRTLIESLGGMLSNIPVIIIFSLFIAVMLNKNLPGKTFFRVVFFLPVVVSVGLVDTLDSTNTVLSSLSSGGSIETGEAMAGGMMSLADISKTLQSLEFSPQLISYVAGAIDNIINVVNQSGVQIIIFMVGLQSISPAIYESALVEGASGWEIFWKITFPMITPMIFVNLFFSVIDALTRTTNPIMSLIMNMFRQKTGEASAMAWIYFVCVSLLLALFVFICKKAFYDKNKTAV